MDARDADSYIGRYLLIGITHLGHDETVIEQRQLHGRIVRISKNEGIVIQLQGSTNEFTLPPDLESLKPAPKGESRLRSTGEMVYDPDYLTTWTVKQPAPKNN